MSDSEGCRPLVPITEARVREIIAEVLAERDARTARLFRTFGAITDPGHEAITPLKPFDTDTEVLKPGNEWVQDGTGVSGQRPKPTTSSPHEGGL